MDLDELESTVRAGYGSRYHPRSVLICLENTHNSAGGRVLPLAYLREVRLPVHECAVLSAARPAACLL